MKHIIRSKLIFFTPLRDEVNEENQLLMHIIKGSHYLLFTVLKEKIYSL